MRRELFTVALVVDLLSPKTAPLLRSVSVAGSGAPASGSRVAVYPVHAKDPAHGASSCSRVLEKFIAPSGLQDWARTLKADPKGEAPVSAILEKIAFDVEFGLHPVREIIFGLPLERKTDGCGKNICEAFARLRAALVRARRKLRIQLSGPLGCRLPKPKGNGALGRALALEDASARSWRSVARRALVGDREKPSPPGPGPRPEAPGPGVLELRGPPLTVQLAKKGEAPRSLRPPGTLELSEGDWVATVVWPSWLRSVPAIAVQVASGKRAVLDLTHALSSQLTWVKSSPDGDLMIQFEDDSATPPVLVPKDSPPVPLPRTRAFRVYACRPNP